MVSHPAGSIHTPPIHPYTFNWPFIRCHLSLGSTIEDRPEHNGVVVSMSHIVIGNWFGKLPPNNRRYPPGQFTRWPTVKYPPVLSFVITTEIQKSLIFTPNCCPSTGDFLIWLDSPSHYQPLEIENASTQWMNFQGDPLIGWQWVSQNSRHWVKAYTPGAQYKVYIPLCGELSVICTAINPGRLVGRASIGWEGTPGIHWQCWTNITPNIAAQCL